MRDIHDRFTKLVLKNEGRMTEFLTSFLPDFMVEDLLLEDARREDTEHLDPEYAKNHTDVLFSVPSRSGGRVGLYFLIEHKSTGEEDTPLQILKDMVAVYREKKKYDFPVIGILLYQGTDDWDIPLNFQDYLKLSEKIKAKYGRYIPDFEYILLRVREDNLAERVQFIRIEFYLRALLIRGSKNSITDVIACLKIGLPLREEKEELQYFNIVLTYLRSTFKGDLAMLMKEGQKKLEIDMEELWKYSGDEIWNDGIEKGFEKGMEKGVEKGMEKGMEKNNIAIAQKLIKKGFSPEIIMELTEFSLERLQELGLKGS